jgi:hypothetical protein
VDMKLKFKTKWGLAKFVVCLWVAKQLATPTTGLGQPTELSFYDLITRVEPATSRLSQGGSERSGNNYSDTRILASGADGKQFTVSVFAGRIHPFKPPPTHTTTRPCLFGEYFETTVGLWDFSKTHLLRKIGREAQFSHAYEWDDSTLKMAEISSPEQIPQKYEFIGKVFEYMKAGNCQYQPRPLAEHEDPRIYLLKQIEIAKTVNATDIVFSKTTFDLTSQSAKSFQGAYLLPLSKLSDLKIDFSGSTLLLPPDLGGFAIEQSQRVAVVGLNLEWRTQGEQAHSTETTAHHGFYARSSDNSDLWFESIHMAGVPGWGFYFDGLKGGLIANSKIGPNQEGQFGAKDGAIHAINSRDLIIKNNSFSHLGGDGISVHGQMALISPAPIALPMTDEEKDSLKCVGLSSHWNGFSEKETLAFFDSKMQLVGRGQIQKAVSLEKTSGNLPTQCKGFSFCTQVCFAATTDMSSLKPVFATSLNSFPSLFMIHGNTLTDVSGRGILVQGSNGTLSENSLLRIGGTGLAMIADLAHELQGPGAYNITLRNNQLNFIATRGESNPEEALLGGITLAALRPESGSKVSFFRTPLIRHLLIDGKNSQVDNSGSIALQISSASEVEVKQLSIGSSGSSRVISSANFTGTTAEGSVLLTRCDNIDVSGLSSPDMGNYLNARHRTIVVDSQYVSQIRLPLSTRGVPGQFANTQWYITFRSWFKEAGAKSILPVSILFSSPRLSNYSSAPPIEIFSILQAKVGDKTPAVVGESFELKTTSSRWTANADLGWQSPYRVQLRPKIKNNYQDLFISFDKVELTPQKKMPLPFES